MPIEDDSEGKLEDLEDKELHPQEEAISEGEEEAEANGSELVEVVFKGNRRVVYHNPAKVPLAYGSYVIVEADKGEDLGRVGQIGESLRRRRKGKRKGVQRVADERELAKWRQLRPREEEAYSDFQRRVARRMMPMKPVDVEYQLDGKKICFYFTADHRVDFRELVRELASVYRTRIELRQIGVRDEAKRLGGIGPCGRELCCTTFLTEFAPITSQMARDQNLSLNPSKLSGLCGRLKCCLRFEHEFYREAHEKYPKFGTRLLVGGREGVVNKLDFLKDSVTLRFEGGDEQTISLEALGAQAHTHAKAHGEVDLPVQ